MNEEQTPQPSQQLPQEPKNRTKPLVIILVVLLLFAATGYAVYTWQQNRINALNKDITELQNKINEQKKEEVSAETRPAVAAAEPDFSFDIEHMGLKFTVPGEFVGLVSATKAYSGDQAVNSVQFTTKTLTTTKCPVAAAPLGILRYGSDQGGVLVATVGTSKLYYIAPTGECAASNYKDFQAALKTLVSNQ